jgi:sulfatase modifying factor 1
LGPDAGDDGSPPSCTPGGTGMTNCGDGGESCCTSLEVEGGTYYRTYTNEGTGPAGEADPATVSGFRLDKYLVTVGRFRQFVRAWDEGAGYLPPAGSGKHTHLNAGLGLLNVGQDAGVAYETGWLASDDDNIAPTDDNLTASCLSDPSYATWTPSPGEQENLPINCVNWWESYAFCIWDGGFLPSESEWEYAAAGGSQQREYPWGAADPGTNSRYAIYGDYYEKDGAASIAPVGIASLGAGYWGQLDMAGEIFESSLDWFAGDYVNPCVDCAYLVEGSNPARVERGADFVLGPSYLTPTFCSSSVPTNRGEAGGVRCARTP